MNLRLNINLVYTMRPCLKKESGGEDEEEGEERGESEGKWVPGGHLPLEQQFPWWRGTLNLQPLRLKSKKIR